MTYALTFVVSCEVLGLSTFFVGSYWGHAMFKCCQYVIDDLKICVGLPFISIKGRIINFVKNHYLDQEKWQWIARMTQSM